MTHSKIRKVLVANRGEIALRIARAATKAGIKVVSVCSEADKNARFAREAETLEVIGPAAAKESYLSIEKLIAAAKKHSCDAVHPGYGFLSENAEFARAVQQAGMIFIGPSPESIEILGSKTKARERVTAHGVPCTPGLMGTLPDGELSDEATKIGFPVIIKAVAGGGGRGMRVVQSAAELQELLPRAKAEALKNFGREDVYIEKYIKQPRHVEVQIFGDSYGNVVHFGTRDCSTQRRHQKLVEEAPAPRLSPILRERIHEAAVKAAKSVGYANAGTAEFLVKGEEFYFLEMNTRIQVEHPVTEMVTGVDLVELQFKIAAGEPLPFNQKQIKFNGHAIEFRIYAENSAEEFRPAVGKVEDFSYPKHEWLREDGAVEAGDEISVYYDAMISKLIVLGENREDAIKKAERALAEVKISGVQTTLGFHRWLLRFSPFREAPLDIAYVERSFSRAQLDTLALSDIKDPMHQRNADGMETIETFRYNSKKFGQTYGIKLIHEQGGTFLALPELEGRAPNPALCARSNGRERALSALKENLDKVAPEELFFS